MHYGVKQHGCATGRKKESNNTSNTDLTCFWILLFITLPVNYRTGWGEVVELRSTHDF